MSELEDDEALRRRVFLQRRRINARLTQALNQWPLENFDRAELEAVNALLADVEKAIGRPAKHWLASNASTLPNTQGNSSLKAST